ncbi:hypothetical protein ACIQU4_04225 [Streptomyces sp. NPDC090741]|uniref:hypothetical protein n=1 Tax=Streptomyces sp. NPDC090741 TaxID=3365967 RepID=UPI0038181E59
MTRLAKTTHPDRSSHHLGRRGFLTALGTAAATFATGVPAHATEHARDAASAVEYVDVQLLNITDLHGYLQAAPGTNATITGNGGRTYTVGGVAHMGAHLARLRADRANSFFFTPGDAFSGWEFDAAAFADEPTIEALNRMGLDFATAGNHEFDKSPAFLQRHMEQGVPFTVEGLDATFTPPAPASTAPPSASSAPTSSGPPTRAAPSCPRTTSRRYGRSRGRSCGSGSSTSPPSAPSSSPAPTSPAWPPSTRWPPPTGARPSSRPRGSTRSS